MPLLSIPKDYADGDILFEADLDAVCDAVETFLNGTNLDSDNIQTSITNALVFTGLIAWYGNATPPSGWLTCDGSAVSQATYPGLYDILQDTYGPDTGGNFTLPDFTRFTPMGPGGVQIAGPATTLGSTGGAETHTLASSEMAAHSHSDSGHTHGQNWAGDFLSGGASTVVASVNHSGNAFLSTVTPTGTTQVANVQSTGGGGTHNNVQPSLISHFIIKT